MTLAAAECQKFVLGKFPNTAQVMRMNKHTKEENSFSNMDNILFFKRGKQQIKTNAFATFISPLLRKTWTHTNKSQLFRYT